jgi:hypothetical protein
MRETERRSAVRYSLPPNSPKASVRDEQGNCWQARVFNISATGICLAVNRRMEPGEVLTIEMVAKGEPGSCSMRARVVRIEPDVPGSWRAGCSLLQRLTEFELLTLL